MKYDKDKLILLRKITNTSISLCIEALSVSNNDINTAIDFINTKLTCNIQNKQSQNANMKYIAHLIHNNYIYIVEYTAITDFTLRSNNMLKSLYEYINKCIKHINNIDIYTKHYETYLTNLFQEKITLKIHYIKLEQNYYIYQYYNICYLDEMNINKGIVVLNNTKANTNYKEICLDILTNENNTTIDGINVYKYYN